MTKLVVTLVAAIVAGSTAAIAAGGTASVGFTSAQSSAGAKQFATSCAQCHGARLEGGAGPALTGPNFKTLSSKVGATVGDVFTYMTTNMPLNAPASLSHDQYVNIMAFILSKNGYRARNTKLTYAVASKSSAKVVK